MSHMTIGLKVEGISERKAILIGTMNFRHPASNIGSFKTMRMFENFEYRTPDESPQKKDLPSGKLT